MGVNQVIVWRRVQKRLFLTSIYKTALHVGRAKSCPDLGSWSLLLHNVVLCLPLFTWKRNKKQTRVNNQGLGWGLVLRKNGAPPALPPFHPSFLPFFLLPPPFLFSFLFLFFSPSSPSLRSFSLSKIGFIECREMIVLKLEGHLGPVKFMVITQGCSCA